MNSSEFISEREFWEGQEVWNFSTVDTSLHNLCLAQGKKTVERVNPARMHYLIGQTMTLAQGCALNLEKKVTFQASLFSFLGSSDVLGRKSNCPPSSDVRMGNLFVSGIKTFSNA